MSNTMNQTMYQIKAYFAANPYVVGGEFGPFADRSEAERTVAGLACRQDIAQARIVTIIIPSDD